MFGIGAPELVMLAVAALIIFGPQRLPEIAGQVGKAIRDFRRMSDDLTGEFQRSMALDEPTPANATPLLTSETIGPSSTPNGIGDTIADSLRVETIPADTPEPATTSADGAATDSSGAATTSGQDTVISLAPVAPAIPMATKAEPLAGVSLLDEPTRYVAERTDHQTGMVVAAAPAVAATEEVAPATAGADAPVHEGAAMRTDNFADAWDAVLNTTATAPRLLTKEELYPEDTAEADGAIPEAPQDDGVLPTTEATADTLPIPDGYAYPPDTYQAGPIPFSEPTRERIDPDAELTIREKIEAQVAAEAFRERRRIANYQRSRRKD